MAPICLLVELKPDSSPMTADFSTLLPVAHAGVTCFMTGLIWFVQIVHYPLFATVGEEAFAIYERQNTRRTAWLVIVPMLLELVLAAVLVWQRGDVLSWTSLLLLGLIWFSAAIWQMPLHQQLEKGFDADSYQRLVRTNLMRTMAWSLRGTLALAMMVSS